MSNPHQVPLDPYPHFTSADYPNFVRTHELADSTLGDFGCDLILACFILPFDLTLALEQFSRPLSQILSPEISGDGILQIQVRLGSEGV